MGFRDRGKTPFENEYGPGIHSEVRIMFPISKLFSFFKKKKKVVKEVSGETNVNPQRTGKDDESE